MYGGRDRSDVPNVIAYQRRSNCPIAKLRGIEKHIVVEGIISTLAKAVLIDVESHALIIAVVADIVIRCCALGSVARM